MGSTRGDFFKYPRTPHVFHAESGTTPDDKKYSQEESLGLIQHPGLVVEEKIDGTNVGINFDAHGEMVLQNRGHIIQPGEHRQYDLVKPWALTVRDALFAVLGQRYLLFGEWMYARHTVVYTHLPHYFMEFDIYDKVRGAFLDTDTRHAMLQGTGVVSVPVIHRGSVRDAAALKKLIVRSLYGPGLAEGLYLKTESDGVLHARGKFVRPEFVADIVNGAGHWATRPVVPNGLAEGVSLW